MEKKRIEMKREQIAIDLRLNVREERLRISSIVKSQLLMNKLFLIFFLMIILLCIFPAQLLASPPEGVVKSERIHKGLFVSVMAVKVADVIFPSKYYLHDQVSDGRPRSFIQIDLADEKRNSSKGLSLSIGFGGAFALGRNFFGTIKFNFNKFTFADFQEQMTVHEDYNYDAATGKYIFVNKMTDTNFIQSGGKVKFYLLSFDLGWLPFKSFDLAFCGGFGFGYIEKKYHSGTCEAYDNRAQFGKLKNRYYYDLGKYYGQDKWANNRLTFNFSMGVKYFFLKKASIDIDYKIIWLTPIPDWGPDFSNLIGGPPDLGHLYYEPLRGKPVHWLAAALVYYF